MKINDNVIKIILKQAKKDFSFSPKDQFAALKYARSKGLKILANCTVIRHHLPVLQKRI